jgi:hypothetical protein
VSERQSAQFGAQVEHHRSGLGARHGGGARNPDDPAGTAQTEDRQTHDVAAERHFFHQQGIEAGCCDAGGRDGDDRVDIDGPESGIRQRAPGRLGKQRDRVLQKELIAFAETVVAQIPLQRHAGMAPFDPGIGIDGNEPLDVTEGCAEQSPARAHDIGLIEHMGGQGGGERRQPGNRESALCHEHGSGRCSRPFYAS